MRAFFVPISEGEYSSAVESFTEVLIKKTSLLPYEVRPRLELFGEKKAEGEYDWGLKNYRKGG